MSSKHYDGDEEPICNEIMVCINDVARAFPTDKELDLGSVKQETALAVLERIRQVGYQIQNLRSFIWGVYDNKFKAALRKWYVENRLMVHTIENDSDNHEGQDPLAKLIEAEQNATRIGLIEDLNFREKEILILYWWEGLSHRQIGDQLGITEGAARQRLWKVHDKLRGQLREINENEEKTVTSGGSE